MKKADDSPTIPSIVVERTPDDPGAPITTAVPPTLDLPRLARLLYFSAGVLRRRAYPGGEIYFRAAACTGALYHIDLYAAVGDLPDLAAGVYHFGPHDFALRLLRSGDHRAWLVEATAGDPTVAAAPVVLLATSTFWRNAWKYRTRTYRHCFWDAGTHMSKREWAASCRRVQNRLESLKSELTTAATKEPSAEQVMKSELGTTAQGATAAGPRARVAKVRPARGLPRTR